MTAPSRPVRLSGFTPATSDWFLSTFPQPTAVQLAAWSAIAAQHCALVIAPTGSGKTLAAFLHAIDRLFEERDAAAKADQTPSKPTTRVLYISPIKALGSDVQRNLNLPLQGVSAQRALRGDSALTISVGMRTGDTPQAERARLLRRPPDILITTPESLYLMLTSKARETLRGVQTVIVDEVHAVAGSKRGSHLALSLERLDALLPQPAQRIGLSATVRPVDQVARFLGGARPVTVVNPPSSRQLEVRIVVPVEDMSDLSARNQSSISNTPGQAGSIWPHVEASILQQVLKQRSTLVFTNARGLAEKLTARLNELYAEQLSDSDPPDNSSPEHFVSSAGGTTRRTAGELPLIARAHHGSVSKEQRADIESALKSGELRCVVATSSLELGIDMGLVDLVIQVAAPPSVASALQRVGRAGHQVGGVSAGLIYPRTRRDLLDAVVTVDRMLSGQLETLEPPRNPLDVLAQQTVAAVAMEPLAVDDWFACVRRADPFRALTRSVFDATLEMLAGRFPSDEFAEFRPRLVWNRQTGQLTARPGSHKLAVISGGTIADRGMFSVMLPEGEERAGSRRVGELDEEMVYESRVNDVITLGASSWRIQQITRDQVIVTPAPGRSARLPFWRGDGLGRPAELGEAIGAFLRELDIERAGETPSQQREQRLKSIGLDDNAVNNLLALVTEQREATGTLPTDRALVIERCVDETLDWRVILHSPYGQRVHGPWGLAIAERIRQRLRIDPCVVSSDDGIIVRIPASEGRVPGAELFVFEPEGLQRIVADAVGGSALFAARFRECAARALLLPRNSPGKRSPLWQQRLRAGQLLAIASDYPDFPILIETARECLQDVYDLPALDTLMRRLNDGTVQFVEVTTQSPSPFAAGLLFGYVGEFMYQGDAPLAERRASVLSLDSGLLADLLGQVDMGDVLDPAIAQRVEQELQHTAQDRRVAGAEGVADLLRELGPLSATQLALRVDQPDDLHAALHTLSTTGRAIAVSMAGETRWAAVEDAARLRDALGVSLPAGIAEVFLQPVADPLRDLLARYARSHGPFTTGEAARYLGLGVAIVDHGLERLREQGKVLCGNFGVERRLETTLDATLTIAPKARHEWIADEVFKRLRLRSLQAAREATRPVPEAAYVRLLLERQGLIGPTEGHPARAQEPPVSGAFCGMDGLLRVIEQLAGRVLPLSVWEYPVLAMRVSDYTAGMLDELISTGEVLWSGHGALGDDDGLVALHLRDYVGETLPPARDENLLSPLQQAILNVLADGGAYFGQQLATLTQSTEPRSADELHQAIWDLVWRGFITGDSWAPLRQLTAAQAPQRTRHLSHSRHRRGHLRAAFIPLASPPTATRPLSGRWSILPHEPVSDTARALALVEGLFDRYGVVTRGAALQEDVPGGFPALAPVLRTMEDTGRILRGRFVEGLGGAQFAERSTIDRLRALADSVAVRPVAIGLSVLDPANPFGVTLTWPANRTKTTLARRAGALVVIVDASLLFYLPQGGRQLISFAARDTPIDAERLKAGAQALVAALRKHKRRPFTLERIDEQSTWHSPITPALREAGFASAPKGLSWYG